jgi:hypothetical protein
VTYVIAISSLTDVRTNVDPAASSYNCTVPVVCTAVYRAKSPCEIARLKIMRAHIVLFGLVLHGVSVPCATASGGATLPWMDPALPVDRRVALLMAVLTPEEKSAQLAYSGKRIRAIMFRLHECVAPT